MCMYDDIGDSFWSAGITAKAVKSQLDGAPNAKTVRVRLNSPGGDAIEGVAIYNVLRDWAGQHASRAIHVKVDGIAASAASIIAMAGDKVTMGVGAMAMIHCAWSRCMGYATDMLKTAEILDCISQSMADIYSAKTGMTSEACYSLMAEETWMTAGDCVEQGFADDIAEETDEEQQMEEAAMAMASSFQLLSGMKKVPERLRAKLSPIGLPVAASGSPTPFVIDAVSATATANAAIGLAKKTATSPATSTESNASLLTVDSILRTAWSSARSGVLADIPVPSSIGSGVLIVRQLGTAKLARRADAAKDATKPVAVSAAVDSTAADANSDTVSGILAPYSTLSCDLGGFREEYQPGCFTSWLRTSADYRILSNHNLSAVLGRRSSSTARMWDTQEGLAYSVSLPDTTAGRDTAVSLSRRDIDGASAAFWILAHRWETREGGVKVRIIEQAAVLEGSIETFPAYASATAVISSAPPIDRAAEAAARLAGAATREQAAQAAAKAEQDRLTIRLRSLQVSSV